MSPPGYRERDFRRSSRRAAEKYLELFDKTHGLFKHLHILSAVYEEHLCTEHLRCLGKQSAVPRATNLSPDATRNGSAVMPYLTMFFSARKVPSTIFCPVVMVSRAVSVHLAAESAFNRDLLQSHRYIIPRIDMGQSLPIVLPPIWI